MSDSSITDRPLLDEITPIMEEVRLLAKRYKALTGKPLGVTGEMAEYLAAKVLALELADVRTPGYDAMRGDERIQIKGRLIRSGSAHGRVPAIKRTHSWHTAMLVLMDEGFALLEIWEASRDAVSEALDQPGSKARNERGAMAVSKFKQIGKRIWPVKEQDVDQQLDGTDVAPS